MATRQVASVQILVKGSREQAQEEINRLAATITDAGYDVLGWDVEGTIDTADIEERDD